MKDRFHDKTLHALIHIQNASASYSIASLHQAVKGFTKECLMPAVERGWVTIRPSTKGASIVEMTDAGEKWLRKLCDLSNEQPITTP